MDCIHLDLTPQDTPVGGIKQLSVGDTSPLHTHSFYEFFLVCRGCCIHEINGTHQLLKEGALELIRPNDMHRFSFFNEYDAVMISIGVSVELFLHACSYWGLTEQQVLSKELPPMTELRGEELALLDKKLTHVVDLPDGEKRRSYFMSILPELFYLLLDMPEVSRETPEWLIKLLRDMSQPENFTAGLPAMLRLSNCTQEHLNRTFRKYLDMTPTEYINARRVDYACKLLRAGDMKTIDVCYMCGFNNLTIFYRNFERVYHCTPKELLRRM